MINEHALEAWDQVAILRHIPNDVMKLMIVHRRLCRLIVEGGLFKLLLADFERLQLWQAAIFTGKTRDIGIDQWRRLEKTAHHGHVHRDDLCPLILGDIDKAFSREFLQNFAQWGA